jgi:hypothetical protein
MGITLFRILTVYLVIVNIAAFIMYYTDKKKAVKHRWRISEAALIGIAAVGGSIGAFAAMKIFRHKTRHPKFYITIPVLMAIYIAAFIFAAVKLIF